MRERVEAAAARAGYHSQEDLAVACGVKQPSVNALLSGKYPMKKLLSSIAKLTKVDERWLRFGDADARPPWAKAEESQTLIDEIGARVSKAMANAKPRPDMITLLELILQEQRRTREAIERCLLVSDDVGAPAPRRIASIPRAADGVGTVPPSTRESPVG